MHAFSGLIYKNEKSGEYYVIPNILDFEVIPEKVVNSFLDFISKFTQGTDQVILKNIKEGLLEIECD